jgi:hypothetical protein
MFDVIRKEYRHELTHLCGIWGDGRQNTHKLPEIEPEGVIGYRVCVQVIVVLYSTGQDLFYKRHQFERTEFQVVLEVNFTP